jgi:hypothetical protein
MVDTQAWQASRTRAADSRTATASGGGGRTRRRSPRLWVLLNAQALIRGPFESSGDVTFIEDDRRRLAGRRQK